MENLLQQYLSILDIDPAGYYLRLINRSLNHSLDLSNVQIQQRKRHENAAESIVNVYQFDCQIQPLLPVGQFVTVYSREYFRVRREIKPNIFIAQSVGRWATANFIQTELLINQMIFNRSKNFLSSENDVPFLYTHSVFPLVKSSRRVKSALPPRPLDFHFPYCLSDNNITNPYTSAVPSRKLIEWKSSICRSTNGLVKDFDTYAQRLTTSPKRIQSAKNRATY